MATIGQDSFVGRTVASGLGTATDGQVWTQDTGTSIGSVGGSEGKVTGSGTSGNTFLLGTLTSARQNVSMRVKYSGTGDIVGVMGRRTAATTYYRANLRAGNFEIRLDHAGTVTQLVVAATTALSPNPFTFAVNTFYWMKFDLNGTTLQAKCWPDGHTEPATYQLSVTDSTITAAGGFGLYALVNPSSDSVSFDTFLATDGVAVSPVLATAPGTLSFSAVVGGSSPATQNDTLSETAGIGTAWTSSIAYGSGSGWLGIAASSGSLSASGTATIVYTCTTGALAVGTYTATVTYTATTGGATATVVVTFVVNATTAVLNTSPATLSFSAMVGGSNPATQNDVLMNAGGTTSAWTSAIVYGSGSGWLGIAASSGSLTAGASATIVYTCTTGARAVGTYTATVTYTATTGGATAVVVVTFVVTSAATTYLTYKNTIEPNMVAAMATHNLLNFVQLIGPDTSMAADSWLNSSSADLSNTLGGYVRHAFPAGVNDIANDSRENAVRTLIAGIYANDNTNKPVMQGEMGYAAMGPGQSVNSYQYGVEMADYAVQLARAGMAVLIAYLLDDDMHGTQWGMWEITADTGVPRPWFFPWAVMTQTLVPGSQLYASAQPASNDFRFLAARSPQGAWTFVLVNRKAVAVNAIVQVPFAPVATNAMQSYTYSDAAPLLVDGSGFPLPSGTVSAVLSRGFTMSMAANSVLILSQQTATTATLFDVKRPPLQRRR